MSVSNIKSTLPCSVEKAWNIVTNISCYSWRSDISKVEIISENQFIEYTKDGYKTTFTITKTIPEKRWEFDIENNNMKGHWIGIFSGDENNTILDFTEIVTAKKLILKPFVKIYLKNQQKKYINDLKKACL